MAKFYLDGIPKAPGTGPEPQGAQVPKAPYRRVGEPAQYGSVDARVQNIDIAKNIPSLMQKELPANLSNALVQGQQRTAAAWGGAAESFADLAETAGKVAGALSRSKDLRKCRTGRDRATSIHGQEAY